MTFICAMGANGFFGAVADILLTTPNESGAVYLPLHRQPQRRRGPLGHIGSMAQKAVVIGNRTLVLWAGPLFHAQRVLKRIEAVSNDGDLHVDVKKICADLEMDPSALGLSIIHCFINGDIVEFNSVNAGGRSEPPFYYAGSGSEHFLNDLSTSIGGVNGENGNPLLNVFIPRILSAKINEAVKGDVFDHHYGGWFEVVEIIDGAFRKQCVCLKIWEQKDDAITRWGPLWFSLYNGNDLHVASVLTHEHDDKNVELEINVTVVNSILYAERPKPDLNDLKCECAIELHVIVERETGRVHSVILHGLKPEDRFQWARTKDGAKMALSPALQAALRDTLDLT